MHADGLWVGWAMAASSQKAMGGPEPPLIVNRQYGFATGRCALGVHSLTTPLVFPAKGVRLTPLPYGAMHAAGMVRSPCP
jgi:hypothetical protein